MMHKKGIFITLAIILIYVLIISDDEKPVDWTPTYDDSNTKPLDTKIFFDELPSWFYEESIKKIYISFYEYYIKNEHYFSSNENNYISVSDQFNIDPSSFDSLLDFIADGNYAFISAHNFPEFVKDTLNFEIEYMELKYGEKMQTIHLYFNKDSLNYSNKLERNITYFKDTLLEKKLGYNQLEKMKEQINFIGIPYYDGIFYLHTNPEIFTNYQLLESDNTNYISTIISYLPKGSVFFNRTLKYDPNLSSSPLRFIYSQPPLKWAWIVMLTGIGFFMYFNGKRRQRIIPINPINKNTTTEFVKTVSNLFFESEDYNNIIHKKIKYFLEHVRSYYHMSTDKLDKEFVKKLALKSDNSIEDVQSLITMICKMKDNYYKTKMPLINLNKKIEDFYKT